MKPIEFQQMVYEYYDKHGRDLPWRKTRDPYAILVSEVMLQQTQVDRVVKKYLEWMAALPTFQALADAELSQVLKLWSGLGYNRRAKFLHQLAQIVVGQYNSRLPSLGDQLKEMPGIGTYTAASIQAFAFNKPVVVIDTNIRSIYIHYFLPQNKQVNDRELIPLIEATMDKENPNKWYNALMDFGVYLKSKVKNPSRRSKHYNKQSKFEGSMRRIRGAVLKYLVSEEALDITKVADELAEDPERVERAVKALVDEGMVKETSAGYRLG